MSKKITQQVWELAQPVVESFGLRLWDVEYVREGAEWFLRLYIDKDGPVDINDCEKVSRAIDPLLDEKDPIPDSYSFEVCSAGCERVLKRPREGRKEYVGVLKAYADGVTTVETDQGIMEFTPEETALVRLYAEF